MKIKVAIIDPLGAHGSSFHMYTFGQAIGLHNSGVSVRIYTNKVTSNPSEINLSIFNYFGNIFKNKSNFLNGLIWIKDSCRSIIHARFSGYKIFHFHIFYTNILVLFNIFLVKIFFGKAVLTVHDVSSFSDQKDFHVISKLVYNLADSITTHNQFSKNEIIKMHNYLNKKIHIIPHGNYIPFINLQSRQAKSRDKLNLPKDKKILLFFGMIKKVKGLDVLLKAFQDIVLEFPEIILLVAGKPWKDKFDEYQYLIDKYNLTDNVILYTKFIPENQVSLFYSSCDLVVLPYKKIYQSGVLMMALSYERPVLVSDLSPLKELITNNENGFTFQSENSADLSDRLKEILFDKENLDRVAKNGVELIKTKYNWNKIGRLSKKIYQDL